jgi:ABC-type multidrug transport system ATPase subunit
MSEGILKALMQLFALVAFSKDDSHSRRSIVRNFLSQQLSQQQVDEYLKLFDHFFQEHKGRLLATNKIQSRIASSSVKALKIATSINEELTHFQKLIVLSQLIEFLNSGTGIISLEHEFIESIALTLNISHKEFDSLLGFITCPFTEQVIDNQILVISGKEAHYKVPRFFVWPNLTSELRVLQLESEGLFLLRFDGQIDLTINGQLISPERVHVLKPGTAIRNSRIDPIFYSDILSRFADHQETSPLVFDAIDIDYRFSKKSIGLHPLSFTSHSGKMVGIMGDSGAGKTTLINILSGILKPENGCVTINGIDIHQNTQKVKGLIGYVSQDDLLMEELTVFQNLYYNAKLCFSEHSEFQIKRKVLKLLYSLGLYEIKDNKVGNPLNKNISGGQRKRLNIALELIREPAILFLDEPTSGLSSRDSENIIDLLKELAIKGKLVFVVIHQPSSDVFKMFNQLLVLDTGGFLIYNGDAVEGINYFRKCINHANQDVSECPACGNVNAEQILNIINTQVIDEYGNLTPNRKFEPLDWFERFTFSKALKTHQESRTRELPPINFHKPNRWNQFLIFLKRDVLSKLSNNQYLFINLLETPVLALILALILRFYDVDATRNQGYLFSNNPNLVVYIIIAVIIAIFVGLTVSAEEIINDRKILKREAFLDLSRLSYLFSKITLLGVLSAVQTLMFVLIGNYILEIRQMNLYYWLILFSASVFANVLGLIISDALKKTVNIYILIPFLVIPQLILSGVFVSYDRLNPQMSSPEKVPWFGEIITARWAFEALAVNQFKNNLYETHFFEYNRKKSEANFKKEFWYPAMTNYLWKAHRLSSSQPQELSERLKLIKKELIKENQANSTLDFEHINLLTPQLFNDSAYHTVKQHLDQLRTYYRLQYNKADEELDNIKKEMGNTPEKRNEFLILKDAYYNEDLERFVRNNNNFFTNKIIEYNGELIQKVDPIYKRPESRYIQAHYFSPEKQLGNYTFSTYWINLIIIWLFNAILFISLYFKILPHLLSLGNRIQYATRKLYYKRTKTKS